MPLFFRPAIILSTQSLPRNNEPECPLHLVFAPPSVRSTYGFTQKGRERTQAMGAASP